MLLLGLGSCFDLEDIDRNSHNMQGLERLAAAQRAGPAAVQEAWPTQASDHEDGTGRHGFYLRGTKLRSQTIGDRDIKNCY